MAVSTIDSTGQPFIPKGIVEKGLISAGMSHADKVCYLPIMSDSTLIGILSVWGSQLDIEDIPALSIFSNQVSTAINKATLLEKVQSELQERTIAEANLRTALADKDMLLREAHHRVKNNLQVVSSLLKLQMGNMKDPEAIAEFRDSQNRIKAMALIHENLYQTASASRVEFRNYLSGLISNLSFSYRTDSSTVAVQSEGDPVHMDIDTAITCGLIINELLSNALKYAYAGRKPRAIRVILDTTDTQNFSMTVEDDGAGLPPGFDPEQTGTLGYLLISGLVKQLEGTFALQSSHGTKCTVTIPLVS